MAIKPVQPGDNLPSAPLPAPEDSDISLVVPTSTDEIGIHRERIEPEGRLAPPDDFARTAVIRLPDFELELPHAVHLQSHREAPTPATPHTVMCTSCWRENVRREEDHQYCVHCGDSIRLGQEIVPAT